MRIILDKREINDLECILRGIFAPLTTFMNKVDYIGVCKNMHLANGTFFPLPICLTVEGLAHKIGDIVELCCKKETKSVKQYNSDGILIESSNQDDQIDDTIILAYMKITDIYKPHIEDECNRVYGSTDRNHPYVDYKYGQLEKYTNIKCISGPLLKSQLFKFDAPQEYLLSPKRIREYIIFNNIKTIVGFQTRNPLHRAHFELTKFALDQTEDKNAVLFLSPIIGETQPGDVDAHTRLSCYIELLSYYKKEHREVILNLIPLSMRMAGPREACLHAIIRKNYGCTHFIVGRDHAGPSTKTNATNSRGEGKPFYDPYAAQELLIKYSGEIGIKPIISSEFVYNATKKIYQNTESTSFPWNLFTEPDVILSISGTELRRMLKNNEPIPDWFSFPEIIELLRISYAK